jgi:predicted O-methyltransferase YrrM
MAYCKYHVFDNYIQLENQPGLDGKIATHHLKLFHLVARMQSPAIVEFGVDKGYSTCLLATACEQTRGRLYSVDIADCSDVVKSNAWTFIQVSDLNIDTILQQAPQLTQGIDLLHIDSIHTGKHVTELLNTWFPYIKANGYVTFHDIDAAPYKPGQRKQNRLRAREFLGLATAVKNFFYANEDQLFLEFHFGSTGMGIMQKLSPLGAQPSLPVPIPSWPLEPREAVTLLWNALRFAIVQKVKQGPSL